MGKRKVISILGGECYLNASIGERDVILHCDGQPDWSKNADQSYIRTKWGRLYLDSVEHRPDMARLARKMFPAIGADAWDRGVWGFACDSFSSGTLVWLSSDGERARYGMAWTSHDPAGVVVE